METLQINNHEDFEKFIGLLEQVKEFLEQKELVKERIQEILRTEETQFTFEDIDPVFKEIGNYPETIKCYCEMKNVQNPFILEKLADLTYKDFHGELAKIIGIAIRKENYIIYGGLVEDSKRKIESIIERMNLIEEYDSTNNFTSEQKGELKQRVVALLESKKDYEDIAVEVFDNTLSSMKICFTYYGASKDTFEYWNRQLIEGEIFDKEAIKDFLQKDEIWAEELEYWSEDTYRHRLNPELKTICTEVLSELSDDEVERFLLDIQFNKKREYSLFAERVRENLKDYLKNVDDKLTIEHVKASERLRQILLEGEDGYGFDVYKGFPENSRILVLEHIDWEEIAEVLVKNQNTGMAKSIVNDFLVWSGEKSDLELDENDVPEKFVEYIGDRFDEIQEKILRDHELTQKIIPEENLFQVKDLWIHS